MLESKNIRALVDLLIGQALAFANVALTENTKPLRSVCQKVLKECIDFQQDCSLDQTLPMGDDQSRRLKAAGLENALYQLDKLVNDCLLRLVFDVFVELNKEPLTKLRSLAVNHKVIGLEGDKLLFDAVNSFDELSDRLQQIGVFAAAFASNQRGNESQIQISLHISQCFSFLYSKIINSKLSCLGRIIGTIFNTVHHFVKWS